MSDPVQMPPAAAAIPPVAPVRPTQPVEPAKKSQADNRQSSDYQEQQRKANAPADRRLTISRDANLHSFVYRSIAAESGEVVWQWPADEMLRRAEHLRAVETQIREDTAPKNDVDEKA